MISFGSASSTTIVTDIWQVDDWISYEVGILVADSILYTVTSTTDEYIEFMLNNNASNIGKLDRDSGEWIEYPPENMSDGGIYIPGMPFYPNLADFKGITGVDTFNYSTRCLIHVDGLRTVLPVDGFSYEYTNISQKTFYNSTSGFNETVWEEANFSVQLEIHEPTGLFVRMIFTVYSNFTYPITSPTGIVGLGGFIHLDDCHGIFDDFITTTTTNPTTTSPTTSPSTTPTTTTATPGFLTSLCWIVILSLSLTRKRIKRTH
jgi:hypothetical protein